MNRSLRTFLLLTFVAWLLSLPIGYALAHYVLPVSPARADRVLVLTSALTLPLLALMVYVRHRLRDRIPATPVSWRLEAARGACSLALLGVTIPTARHILSGHSDLVWPLLALQLILLVAMALLTRIDLQRRRHAAIPE